MDSVADDMLYAELLKLAAVTEETLHELEDLVSFMRETNRELEAGRVRIEQQKKTLFGDRLQFSSLAHV